MINIKAQQTLVKFNKTDAGTLRYLIPNCFCILRHSCVRTQQWAK